MRNYDGRLNCFYYINQEIEAKNKRLSNFSIELPYMICYLTSV